VIDVLPDIILIEPALRVNRSAGAKDGRGTGDEGRLTKVRELGLFGFVFVCLTVVFLM
jgi:hypothetical protein